MFKVFKEYKKPLLISTYIVILFISLLNINSIMKWILFLFDLFTPIFVALGIAFVLNMPMRAIEKQLSKFIDSSKQKSLLRTISIITTLLLTILVLFLIFSIILPKVIDSFYLVFNNISTLIDNSIKSMDSILKQVGVDVNVKELSYVKNIQSISWKDFLNGQFDTILGVANGVVDNAMAFANTFMDFFLGFCLSIYLLSGKEKLLRQLRNVCDAFFSEKRVEEIYRVAKKAQIIFEKFVGGQLVNCAILGVICYLTYKIMGIQFPELNAALVAILSIIPVFGPLFAMMISFVLIFAFDPLQAVIFIIVFQVVTNIESNVIYPKVVGSNLGLPGVWVLLSIFIFGDLFGLPGMIFAVPFTALVYSLFAELVYSRLAKKRKKV